jgi:hypothetical protein
LIKSAQKTSILSRRARSAAVVSGRRMNGRRGPDGSRAHLIRDAVCFGFAVCYTGEKPGRNNMRLKDYFAEKEGIGVLSTADAAGKVDVAIYARPLVLDDGTCVFIMRDRLTHLNLQSNPFAAYLFTEYGHGYKGLRLYLKKIREDTNPDLIRQLTRRCLSPEEDQSKGPKFLVYFELEKILNLIGSEIPDIQPA